MLLQANAVIDTISDIAWSVVSTIDPSGLNPFETYIIKICTLSSQGVFILIGKDDFATLSGGIRYDPAGAPINGLTRP